MPRDLSECLKLHYSLINCDNSDASRPDRILKITTTNQSIVITQVPRDLSECLTLKHKSVNCDDSDPSRPFRMLKISI